MHCYLATFDPAHRASDGSYWTFRHLNVPINVCDALYYECVAKHWPEDTKQILSNSLQGGCARVHENWVCWYRLVEGGRDAVGRPGRYILLAAFVEQINHQGWDWSGVLESQQFQDLAQQARSTGPLPAPSSLELEWEPPPATEASAIAEEIVRTGSGTVDSTGALRIVAEIGLAVPNGCQFDCFVVTEQGRGRIVCEKRPDSAYPPIPPLRFSDPGMCEEPIDLTFRPDTLHRAMPWSNSWPMRRVLSHWVCLPVVFCFGLSLGIVAGWSMRGSRGEWLFFPQTDNRGARATGMPVFLDENHSNQRHRDSQIDHSNSVYTNKESSTLQWYQRFQTDGDPIRREGMPIDEKRSLPSQ